MTTPTKAEIRAEIRAIRRTLDYEAIRRKSLLLQDQVLRSTLFENAAQVGAYLSQGTEPRTDRILHAASLSGKRTCVPVWNREAAAYSLAEWSPDVALESGPFGIPQPVNLVPVAPDEVELLFLPVVAVDRAGRRVGHGKGDIDRLLAGFTGIKAALAFDFQIIPEAPEENHDVRVDFVVSQTSVYDVNCNSLKLK